MAGLAFEISAGFMGRVRELHTELIEFGEIGHFRFIIVRLGMAIGADL